MSHVSLYTKYLYNFPLKQNENAVVHSILILKKIAKRMRMKSKRLVQQAANKHIGGLIPRSITWEYAAQLVEEEIEVLNGRLKRSA